MAYMDGTETKTNLIELIQKCKRFWVVTAWATPNVVFEEIKNNIKKLEVMIVGVDFYQTSPDVLEWLNNKAKQKTNIGQCKNGVFHPKLYIFDLNGDETRTVVIGSANLTNAAFSSNDEYCVKINSNEKKFKHAINEWLKNSITVSDLDLAEYKRNYNTIGANLRAQIIKLCPSKKTFIQRHSNLLSMSFDHYHSLCTQESQNGSFVYSERIDLINYCLQHIPLTNQNDLCIFSGLNSVQTSTSAMPGTGWFGIMMRDIPFQLSIRADRCKPTCPKHWQNIINLINSLPTKLKKQDFLDFGINLKSEIDNYLIHHSSVHGKSYKETNHLAATTRILAMARPDQFFCINSANKDKIANDFNMTTNGKNGIFTNNGYWYVIQKLQNSTWGNSTLNHHWSSDKIACWKGRIAMIDALYY